MHKLWILYACFAGLALGQTGYIGGSRTIEGPINYCGTDTGSATAFVCANPAGATLASYQTGNLYSFTPAHSNTGPAPTLAIDGLTAKTILKQQGAAAIASGDIVSGNVAIVQYDGTQFELINPATNGGGSGGSSAWSSLTSATGSLTLTNGTNATTFAQTNPTVWTWTNTTSATSGTAQLSPSVTICGQGWEGASPASASDCWALQNLLANGANPNPVFVIKNTGSSTATPYVQVPNIDAVGSSAGSVGSVVMANGGTGTIPPLPTASAGFAAPATGGTPYLMKLPATITAGSLGTAAPASHDGVNESAVTVMPYQGTDANVLTSGTVSAAAGSPLCTDSNSGATTSGCVTGNTISNVTSYVSSSTLAATWNTTIPSDSNLQCGTSTGVYTITAVDAHVETNVTSHQAIVTGLSASTLYYCSVYSTAYGGGTVKSTEFSTTTSAAAATVAISAYTVGTWNQVGNATVDGQGFANAVCGDQNTYVAFDQSHGYNFGGGSANMMVANFASEVSFAANNINYLPGYGAYNTPNGSDGSSHTRVPSIGGMSCINGYLYALSGRINNASSTGYPESGTAGLFNQGYGTMLVSHDLGATWNNIMSPGTYSAYAYPAGPTAFNSAIFGSTTQFGASSFVEYGVDDGTLGYTSPSCDVAVSSLTTSCKVDNADAYVYILGNDGFWNNGSNLYLARVPKAKLKNLNPGDIQYYSVASSNGLLDSSWSSSIGSAVSILNVSGQVSIPTMQYVPALNRYALIEWYYQNCVYGGNTGCPSNSTNAGNTFMNLYDAPHPWGPFTSVGTISSVSAATGTASGSFPSGSGLSNPVILQRSAVTATGSSPSMELLAGGNPLNAASWYTINYASLQLNITSAPNAPTQFVVADVNATKTGLNWKKLTGLTYNLFRSTTNGFTPGAGNQIATGVNAGTYIDSASLSASTTYYYAVEAVNSAGSSAATFANTTTVASGTAKPFDTYCPSTNCPLAGWSVSRQLTTAYVGNIIQIQRASDNATQNVGNDGSGNINQTTISTFCSGTTCGVLTVYDQIGTYNLTSSSTTVANMCLIYQSGAVVTLGGKVSCSLTAVSNTEIYTTSSMSTVLNSLSAEASYVGQMNSGSGAYGTFLNLGNGTNNRGSSTQAIAMIVRNNGTNALGVFHDNSAFNVPITMGSQLWANTQYNDPSNGNKTTIQSGASSTTLLMNGSSVNLAATQVEFSNSSYDINNGTQTTSVLNGFFQEAYVYNTISGIAPIYHANVQSYFGGSL